MALPEPQKVTELDPADSPLTGAEQTHVVQNFESVRTTMVDIATTLPASTIIEKINTILGGTGWQNDTADIAEIVTEIDAYLGTTEWQARDTGAEIVTKIDIELGGTLWQGTVSGAEIVASINTELGSTVWQFDTQLTDSEVVTAVDTDLGNILWRTPEIAGTREITGTTGNLVLSDAQLLIKMNSATGQTLNIPDNTATSFPLWTRIHVWQAGTGQTTVAMPGSDTLNSAETLKLRAQHSIGTLLKVAATEWIWFGDLELT